MTTIKQRAKKHLAETMAGIVKRATTGRNISFADITTPWLKGNEITAVRLAIIHAAASSGITSANIARGLNLGRVNATLLVKKADCMYSNNEAFRDSADLAYQSK